ncbi:MAG: DUF2158 domain-containing protein [Rhodobiaceae bacterium]|jgi:uncharacterized protein YodC (DUF2158 family)|nr:DUF2158 domain-containing protein [Rhodobiaceae bacterium]MBT5518951.1 DUF2158 domain-containing protein [Rhodobiaceae bacterium]MBT7280074.1 DUF2158 domain-containing protein [Rhodobiaceae bacterium]MDG2495089.1 DUF2158 domain-containing protein [Alphaproteobacteria bacterium]
MAEKLKLGSVVELNSGSPLMTIVAKTGGNFQCAWFADSSQVSDAMFSPASLKLAEEKTEPNEVY